MQFSDTVTLLRGLDDARIAVWLDGGWCVEALVGAPTLLRDHDDLDIAVSRDSEGLLRSWLASRGFSLNLHREAQPWNYVLTDAQIRSIDVHVFEFDPAGVHVYGIEYPAASLTGSAELGGLTVRCIAPEWMFRFKTAYAPTSKDLIDVHALARTYGYQIPSTHLG